MLWKGSIYEGLAERIRDVTWLFGCTLTAMSFITFDNTVALA